jgi:hypothetical protein
MENIDAGHYDLRYQDLDSGSRFKSEWFPLTEGHETIHRDDGTTLHKSQASDDTITLYTTPKGKFHFREIGAWAEGVRVRVNSWDRGKAFCKPTAMRPST